ncbi:MAG: YdcF family protein [Methyloligellaceae bacterium]
MFFYVSKLLWFFVQPSNAILLLLVAGIILLWSRWARTARRLVLASGLLLFAGGLTPLGHALLLPLEDRLTRADLASGAPPNGIVILGGAQDMSVYTARGTITVNEAAERLIEGVLLARRFPDARIVFTGGSSAVFEKPTTEAAGAAALLESVGVAPERLLLEDKAQDTFQNALFSVELAQPRPGARWLLVTSANHMPRALGCFRKVGFAIEPWPVDYRTRGRQDVWRFFPKPSEGWRRMDDAVREWAGLLAYWVTGRTNTLFPGP